MLNSSFSITFWHLVSKLPIPDWQKLIGFSAKYLRMAFWISSKDAHVLPLKKCWSTQNKCKSDSSTSEEYGGMRQQIPSQFINFFAQCSLALSCWRMTPFLLTISGHFSVKVWLTEFTRFWQFKMNNMAKPKCHL